MINKLPTELIKIKAIRSGPKGYIPHVTKHGTIDNTQMMNELLLKVGARVKLVSNINITDQLVNGAFGTIVRIENNQGGEEEFIMVEFDDESCGEQQRQKFHRVSSKTKYQNKRATPIPRHELEHVPRTFKGLNSSIRCKIIQFPLKLSWASTAHSMQGVTVKKGSKLVIHWHNRFIEGMAYVMLGRCERLQDIHIRGDFTIDNIKVNSEALIKLNSTSTLHWKKP